MTVCIRHIHALGDIDVVLWCLSGGRQGPSPNCPVIIGKQCGLGDEEIRRIQDGPDASQWDPFERTLLRAVDELHQHALVSDATWKELAERYDTQQLMDLVFTVGQYTLVSMALNSFGVELDEGIEGFSR